MTTERRVEHKDGTVEHITTNESPTVVERSGGGGAGILGAIIAVIAVVVIGYLVMNMNRSEQVRDNAIAGAAESIGNAADNVGEAAQRAIPPAQ
ncbi:MULTISPECIES: hypothetical protein [unclassified Brevundimonas]|uniref:hypothetical protein n=1 Tax=unclassified Brevundimonas TaxID=2622653 RepID=UPI0025BDEBC6|nr:MULTISPECIES: hypothetical protein [unclassified Brevundimonas]